MDTMLFRQNTCKMGNNAVEMSQAFHDIALFKRFTDLNLFNARVASGGWVQLRPKAESDTHRSTNLQPSHEPPCIRPANPPLRARQVSPASVAIS